MLILTFSVTAIFWATKVSSADENIDSTYEYIAETTQINSAIEIDFVKKGSMIASWYGPNFHGKQTANTEIFNQKAFTAAHKTLPFGTMLRITNPRNGKQIVVRINDRGPYISGRDIDLSRGAAEALGMVEKGVIRVEVEALQPRFSNI